MNSATAFDVVETTLRCSRERFKEGVVPAAVSAAVMAGDQHSAFRAIVRVFEAHRISINPRWDGSIA